MRILRVFLALSLFSTHVFGGFVDEGTRVTEKKDFQEITVEKDTGAISFKLWGEDTVSIQRDGVFKAVTKDQDVLTMESRNGKEAVLIESRADGTKIDIVLNALPATNIFSLELTGWENFNFYYQPPLDEDPDAINDPMVASCTQTDCIDGEGNVVLNRPEIAVGSYAVYHKTKKHNKYKTGKAFHIYRPKIIDAKGVEIWGLMTFSNGVLSVEVDQDFLNNATYPVRIDPTLGDTTFGVSNGTRAANTMPCNDIGDATEDGTVTSVSLSLDGNGVGTVNVKGVLLDHVDGSPNSDVILTNGVTPSAVLPATASGSYTTINYVSSPSITDGLDYAAGGIGDATIRYYYDSAVGEAYFDDTNSYATPADITSGSTGTGRSFSYYITYTAAGGGGATPPAYRRIIVTE